MARVGYRVLGHRRPCQQRGQDPGSGNQFEFRHAFLLLVR
jgi:hypothetical protein